MPKGLFSGIFDLLLPPRCALCREPAPSGGPSLCGPCLEELALFSGDGCPGCGSPLVGGAPAGGLSCGNGGCRDGLIAVAPFGGGLRKLVHRFKYDADFLAGGTLAALMADRLRATGSGGCDLAVPVPLHRRRLRERGFNQAAFLTRKIARRNSLPLDLRLLVRTVRTESLTGFDRARRRKEVSRTVALRGGRDVRGKRVLLVDDVFTTGATAEECSRALKEGGAEAVIVAVAGRA